MAAGTVCCHCGCPVDADNAAHYCSEFGRLISHEQAMTIPKERIDLGGDLLNDHQVPQVSSSPQVAKKGKRKSGRRRLLD